MQKEELEGRTVGLPWSFSLLMLSVEEKEDVAAGSEPSGWGTKSLAVLDCTLIRKHQPDNSLAGNSPDS